MVTVERYSCYHSGRMRGLGRWSGPHNSREEAERSAGEAGRLYGCRPVVIAETITVEPE